MSKLLRRTTVTLNFFGGFDVFNVSRIGLFSLRDAIKP